MTLNDRNPDNKDTLLFDIDYDYFNNDTRWT